MVLTTPTLLEQMASGDTDAVHRCLLRYGHLVWSLARRFLGNTSEADDATQDIFVELWKNADRYDPELSSETSYISLITRRRLIDRRRKMSRQPRCQTFVDQAHAAHSIEMHQVDTVDEASQATAALQQLHPEQQRVLSLAVYNNLTYREISRSIGLPLGTVKTHARRGLIKLREMLRVQTTARSEYARPRTGTATVGEMTPALQL